MSIPISRLSIEKKHPKKAIIFTTMNINISLVTPFGYATGFVRHGMITCKMMIEC